MDQSSLEYQTGQLDISKWQLHGIIVLPLRSVSLFNIDFLNQINFLQINYLPDHKTKLGTSFPVLFHLEKNARCVNAESQTRDLKDSGEAFLQVHMLKFWKYSYILPSSLHTLS